MNDCLAVISPLQGETVLDVGVGNGRFIPPCLLAGTQYYVGIDMSRALLDDIRARFKSNVASTQRLSLVRSDAEHLPFKKTSFDKIICVGVSYLLPHLESFVTDMSRALKQGGCFLTDYMDKGNVKLAAIYQITKLANHVTRLLRVLRVNPLILRLFTWLDHVPLLGLYEGWFSSYLTYGMTPFYPQHRAAIETAFSVNGLCIERTFTNKSVFILAQKKPGWNMRR